MSMPVLNLEVASCRIVSVFHAVPSHFDRGLDDCQTQISRPNLCQQGTTSEGKLATSRFHTSAFKTVHQRNLVCSFNGHTCCPLAIALHMLSYDGGSIPITTMMRTFFFYSSHFRVCRSVEMFGCPTAYLYTGILDTGTKLGCVLMLQC